MFSTTTHLSLSKKKLYKKSMVIINKQRKKGLTARYDMKCYTAKSHKKGVDTIWSISCKQSILSKK